MDLITYTIDMTSNNNFIQIPTIQGDGNTRPFAVQLIQNNQIYEIDAENYSAIIIGTKPDAKEVCRECEILIEDNLIKVTPSPQMVAIAGVGYYQIMLLKTDYTTSEKITSFPFALIVTESTYDAGYITSSDDFQLLTDTLAKATQDYSDVIAKSKAYADSAEQSAIDAGNAKTSTENLVEDAEDFVDLAKSYAVGTNNVVRSNDKTDNSKYYYEQANRCYMLANSYADGGGDGSREDEDTENALHYYLQSKSYANGTSGIRSGESTDNSKYYYNLAQSYSVGTNNVVRPDDENDNAKYYYEQAKGISEGLNGTLLPMGTITFAQLQNQTKQSGYMYNISDDFISDATFKDGGGNSYSAGTNVYYTADGYWDCLAGTMNYLPLAGGNMDNGAEINLPSGASNVLSIGNGEIRGVDTLYSADILSNQLSLGADNEEKGTIEGTSDGIRITSVDNIDFHGGDMFLNNHIVMSSGGYLLDCINGITDSLTATSSNVALSAKAGKELQTQIDTIGEVVTKTATSETTLNTTTMTEICSFTVSAGTYLLIASLAYQAKITEVAICISNNTFSDYMISWKSIVSDAQQVSLMRATKLTEETTISLRAKGTGIITQEIRTNILQAVRLK